ncbi:aminotransferase class V-fold PLP-dependent enzyme [Nocardioides rotundus]|uniref:kynureninase n=1 Tax=Nocardioides rotundus TaxID=1774216 RepID=UPI001CBBDDB2|nr:aminotransferase class V-fold PLP-dependent enzyme [Nocardioides rotundus]UAL28916.1 aminotransferase class V-fold PLP-dependent enzyme [Nocardioides rotundus]
MAPNDPLAAYLDRFVPGPAGLVYFDGNSLGRPLRATADRLGDFVEQEWAGRLIRGWDEGWYDLPLTVGDELGRVVLGAAPGQVFVGDSTTVLLYKLARAAVDHQRGRDAARDEIVVDTDNFPTDRYLAEGIAAERGLTVRWVETDPERGIDVEGLSSALSERTALVLLSHVAYRSAWLADVPRLTRLAHEAGALVLWDLSHSAGSVPTELDAWEVDLAAGCTYKYLNGGPGSPAFGYVASRHHERLAQPIQGWMGHADPFLMGPGYTPSPGIRRFLSGTPPILGMLAMLDMLALIDEVGMVAVREKSVALTSYAVELVDEVLAPLGVVLASPRDPQRRGGHVTLRHAAMREVVAALWQRDVIPDYRDPGGLRIGLSPLSTSVTEVDRGFEAVREALVSRPGAASPGSGSAGR